MIDLSRKLKLGGSTFALVAMTGLIPAMAQGQAAPPWNRSR